MVGALVGAVLGLGVGTPARYVGLLEGLADGAFVGDLEGLGVGLFTAYVGTCVGEAVGALLGEALGLGVGLPARYDGAYEVWSVGLRVGCGVVRAILLTRLLPKSATYTKDALLSTATPLG